MKQFKLAVSGLIYTENRIVLIRREKAPYKNKWTLPGGSVEENENIDQALKRELLEEVGFFVNITKNSFIQHIPQKDYIIVTKLCIPFKQTFPKEKIITTQKTIEEIYQLNPEECTPLLQIICKFLLEQHEQ